ncbi:MAG: SPOR domain-containing protein [Bacteroidetes bacterium]|nr:SPOR domain-containing protein [Bacteroidota bacterium]
MKRIILSTILIPVALCLFIWAPAMRCCAQDSKTGKGEITIVQDEKVDLLVSKHVRINQNKEGIDGFRIQIFFDSGNNSKTKAQSIYEGFKAKYPDVRAYLSFKSPNYKVRVGDFRTRLDAQRFLNEIIDQYPNAWIIADNINLPNAE